MSTFYKNSLQVCRLLCLTLLFCTPFAKAQLLTEQFEYGATAGDLTTVTNNWVVTGTNTSAPFVQYTTGSLPFGSMPTLGGKATFAANGQDINRAFSTTGLNTGSVYVGTIINIATTSATGDYFFALSNTVASSTLHARIFVKTKGAGFEFGLAKGSTGNAGTTAVYSATSPTYAFNTPYFVVLKYNFGASSTLSDDDNARIFVFPTTVPITEPTATTDYVEATVGTGTLTSLGTACIRQGTVANIVTGSLDYVRVGVSWTEVTSSVADVTPPTFTATFPKTGNVAVTTLDIISNLNEAGKSYFVILPDNATAPTAAQIKAGQNATSTAVATNLKGTINHANPATDYTANVTGLTGATAYDIYVIGEDPSLNQTTVQKLDVATQAPDVTPPAFALTYPKTANVSNTALDILSNINEVGKTYFVILPDNAAAPTAAQIKAGNDASNTAVATNLKGIINNTTANTDFSLNVTGLTANTPYDIYAIAEDAIPNLQANAVKIDITTANSDLVPPAFVATYPKASNIMAYSFTLASNINEVGKTYFVVLPDAATAPTSAQVKAGQDATGTAVGATFKGTINNTTANTEFTATVSGLAGATAYDVFVVAEDAVPNVQTTVIKVDVLTQTPDLTAPTFTATYPKTSNIGTTNLKLLTNINEAGKTYFVVLPDNATAPTSAQVKAGQNGAGTAVTAALKGTINNLASATEYNATIAGLTQGTAYDIYAVAEDAPTFNAPNLQTLPTKVDVSTIVPNTNDIVEDFTTCVVGANVSSWFQESVIGAEVWGCTASGRTTGGAQMNGFAGTNKANEDWLISPSFDISAFSNPNFSFWSASRFAGATLTLKVSTNYTTGSPSTATWSDVSINVNFPAAVVSPATNTNWTESKDIDLTTYKSTNTRLAFVYTSTTTDGTRWTLDDAKIYNKAPQIVLTKDQTLDVMTWNLEWFGDNGDGTVAGDRGPADEVLQRNNIKTVLQQVDADIYCLQEVTNQNLLNDFQTLVNELAPLGYTGVRVTHTSGFGNDGQQARAFIYKTALFSNVTTSVLSLGGTWADGRQPAVMRADVTIQGTTKTINFINIHAKALADLASFTQREANAQALKTYIDGTLGTQNVILMGDFNDDLDNSIVVPQASPYKNFVDDNTGYVKPSKTALTDNNITTIIGFNDPIDHIIVSNELETSIYPNSLKREDFVSTIANYANTTTDHYPVSLRFQLGPVTPDVTPPTFTATFPKVENIGNTTFTATSAINEAGKTYFVVLPNNANAPTALQVKSGQDATGTTLPAAAKGVITHTAPNIAGSVNNIAITILTDYDVYFVAEDVLPNLQTAPVKVDLTAAPADIVPPAFTSSYPKADQIATTTFRLISNLNETGKTYFVVLGNNASAPTSAQVKAAKDANNIDVVANFKGFINNTTANAEFTANIIAAVLNTDYDVYFVAEDAFNNLQLAPVKIDVKTANTTSAEDDITRYLGVYPNPAEDKLTISLRNNPIIKQGEVRLLNVLGQTMQQGKLATHTEGSQYVFDVRKLPAGIYLLELSEGKRKFFRKVVVK